MTVYDSPDYTAEIAKALQVREQLQAQYDAVKHTFDYEPGLRLVSELLRDPKRVADLVKQALEAAKAATALKADMQKRLRQQCRSCHRNKKCELGPAGGTHSRNGGKDGKFARRQRNFEGHWRLSAFVKTAPGYFGFRSRVGTGTLRNTAAAEVARKRLTSSMQSSKSCRLFTPARVQIRCTRFCSDAGRSLA
jgi:hypothetical protein